MNSLKRVAAIHDISGFGKCSLTVALPILSACEIECSCIPTAVLSTHTGGFENYTYKDLTSEILPIAKHWQSLNLQFDAIYSGYLGSFEQIDILLKVFDLLRASKTLIMVDPVMADDGKLYASFDKSFPMEMKKIAKKADILTPNITEACLLTGMEYKEGPFDKEYIKTLLEALHKVCPNKIVLTGVYFDDKSLGCATLENGKISYQMSRKIDGFFHGTGDVFGSALLGAYLKTNDLEHSAQIACDFTANSIERTAKNGTDVRFGVDFEHELKYLINELEK